MSHVTHMKESRHTHEWVLSHVWTSRLDSIQKKTLAMSHTHEWILWNMYTTHHFSSGKTTPPTPPLPFENSADSIGRSRNRRWRVPSFFFCGVSFICVPWRMHLRGMTYLYVCHDPFVYWTPVFFRLFYTSFLNICIYICIYTYTDTYTYTYIHT